MPQLKVMFFGLICHVGKDPNKQQGDHAVLVKSDDHVPLLMWHDGARVQSRILNLNSGDVFIGSLRAKPLPFAPSFQKYGVKLKDLLPGRNSAVTPEVRSRETDDDVHAYVVYPAEADTLRVVKLYPTIGLHRTPGGVPLRRDAVAQITMTTVEAPAGPVSMGYVENDQWVEIASVPNPGCVLFSNAEPDGSLTQTLAAAAASDRPRHVQDFGKITDEPIQVIAEDTQINHGLTVQFPAGCQWVLTHVDTLRAQASEYVDCGNGGDP